MVTVWRAKADFAGVVITLADYRDEAAARRAADAYLREATRRGHGGEVTVWVLQVEVPLHYARYAGLV